MLSVIEDDLDVLVSDDQIPWEAYEGSCVVVSGATGLIGQTLTGALLKREDVRPSGLQVIALVRNCEKARRLFGAHPALRIVEWDAFVPARGLEGIGNADFVFHCANMTDSSAFVERPVDVIQTTVGGARAMLDLARRTGARVCLLSTMETYGEVEAEDALREDQGGFLDSMVVRNSYPEAKRLDEALAAAYVAQYGVKATVARLTQTFGPGVQRGDNRVFAYFARSAIQGEDIVMLTEGTKQNAYLYTADAASALLLVGARGATGRAYNVANDDTYCAVRDMAQLVADEFGQGSMRVRFELDVQAAKRFRKGSRLRLDTSALRALGWTPRVGLCEMYERMIEGWEH